MKTIIFDLDGTLADLKQPLEASFVFLERNFLTSLSGVRFAIVTGGTRKEVAFVLEQANVVDFFDEMMILTREDVFGEKKTGGPFQELMRRIGGEAIVIGDSEADVLGAKRAGLRCLLLEGEVVDEVKRERLGKTIVLAEQLLFQELSPGI